MDHFNHKLIAVGRAFRSVSQNTLVDKLNNFNQPNLSKIEKGFIRFTEENCNLIAEKLELPKVFFLQDDLRLNLSSLDFKEKKSVSKKEYLKILTDIKIILRSIDVLLSILRLQNEKQLMNLMKKMSPIGAARFLRNILRIPNGPIGNTDNSIEELNVVVLFYDTSSHFAGISTFTDVGIPIIIINKNLSNLEKRETFWIELGHLILHINSNVEPDKKLNEQAVLFADEMLMPTNECQEELSSLTFKKVKSLSEKWQVTRSFVINRAKSLNIINDSTYFYLRSEIIRRREPDKRYSEIILDENISNIIEKINLVKNEFNTSIEEFAYSTKLYYKDFERLLFIQ